MKTPSNFLHAKQRVIMSRENVDADTTDLCVPDQCLSIPELLQRYVREQKPLPKPRQYDLESIEMEYKDLYVPDDLNREDALHLMDLTRSHMAKLEHQLRKAKHEERHETPPVPPTPPSPDDVGKE